jgi:hypothetical protein
MALPIDWRRNHNRELRQAGCAYHKQHLPPRSLCKQRCVEAVHKISTLLSSPAQFLVGTSENAHRGKDMEALRSSFPRGTTALHDGLAEVSICLIAQRHASIAEVHLHHMRQCVPLSYRTSTVQPL